MTVLDGGPVDDDQATVRINDEHTVSVGVPAVQASAVNKQVVDLAIGEDAASSTEGQGKRYRGFNAREVNGVIIVNITDRKLTDNYQAMCTGEDLYSLAEGANPMLVIDFSHVEDLNCDYLNKLIVLGNLVQQHHGALRLTGMCVEVRGIFHNTRLNQRFTIVDSINQAVQELRQLVRS